MAGLLDYLMGPQENQLARFGNAITSGMNAYQGEQDRLAALAEKKRLLSRQEAEDKRLAAERERQLKAEERKAKETRLKATEEYIGRMAQAGLGDSAAAAYKQAQGLRTELYGLAGPDIVGGIDPSGAYDVQTHQPMRDFNNPTTLGMLQNLSGVKPEYQDVAPFHTVINKATHQPIYTAPGMVGSDRSGRQFYQPGMGPAPSAGLPASVPPAGGAPMPRGPVQVTAPVAPAPRSSGGGSRGGGRRSGGGSGGRNGKPAAATATTGGAPVKPGTVNSVLSTVDKMKTAVAERHTKGRNTDWAAVDKEWRPRAEAYLKRNGMNPDEYLPAPAKAAPAKPAAQQPAAQPQGNWLQRWFKSGNAPELTPQVASLLQEAGLFEDLG